MTFDPRRYPILFSLLPEGEKYPAYAAIVLADFKTSEKRFVSQGASPEEVKRYFELFKEMKNKIQDPKQKDIDRWAKWEEFKAFVDQLAEQKSKSEIKKLQKMEGAELIAENDQWRVYLITTHEAAKIYGSNTKWCITQNSDMYWKKYSRYSNFYFILSKTLPPTDPDAKVALQVERDGTKLYWDALDHRHSEMPGNQAATLPAFDPKVKERPVRTGKLTVDQISEQYKSELEKIVDHEIQGQVVGMFGEDSYDGGITEEQDLKLPYWMKEGWEEIFQQQDKPGHRQSRRASMSTTAGDALKELMNLMPAVDEWAKDPDNAKLSWSNSSGMMPYGDANYPDDAIILNIEGMDSETESQIDSIEDLMSMLGIDAEDEDAFSDFLEEEGDDVGIRNYTPGNTITMMGRYQVVYAVYLKFTEIEELVKEIFAEEAEEDPALEQTSAEDKKQIEDLLGVMKENAGSYD